VKRFGEYLKEELYGCFLLEGLSASYDVSRLVEELKKTIGNIIKDISYTELPQELKETKYGNVFTIDIKLISPLSIMEKEKVSKVLDFFGYTESMMFLNPLSLQIEPKYPVKMNGFLEKMSDLELFHITEKKNLDKIKRIGLVTKKPKTSFSHPSNRIYFLTILNNSQQNSVLNSWRNVLSRDKGLKPKDMIVLKTVYNPSHDYYFDDTSSILKSGIIGIFSLNNVSPKNLELYEIK
jgi:hypothetical protein